MPIYIYDKNAKEKIAEVEGAKWLEHQGNMEDCSFDAFHRVWHEQINFRKDLIEGGGTLCIDVNGNGAIYGSWGFNRYAVRYSGEIVLIEGLSVQESIEKAKEVGFNLL